MTSAPVDLLIFRQQALRLTGLASVSVGVIGDDRHAATGGYHIGKGALVAIGRYHPRAAAGSASEDYSCRKQRDRAGLTDNASALDIGYNWPNGGNPAWLRFNRLLVADLQAGHPALNAVRATNFSRDGRERKRIDREHGFGEIDDSADSVDIHTHIEFYRDTEGNRQTSFDRLAELIRAAIAGTAPTAAPTATQPEDDMELDVQIPHGFDVNNALIFSYRPDRQGGLSIATDTGDPDTAHPNGIGTATFRVAIHAEHATGWTLAPPVVCDSAKRRVDVTIPIGTDKVGVRRTSAFAGDLGLQPASALKWY